MKIQIQSNPIQNICIVEPLHRSTSLRNQQNVTMQEKIKEVCEMVRATFCIHLLWLFGLYVNECVCLWIFKIQPKKKCHQSSEEFLQND